MIPFFGGRFYVYFLCFVGAECRSDGRPVNSRAEGPDGTMATGIQHDTATQFPGLSSASSHNSAVSARFNLEALITRRDRRIKRRNYHLTSGVILGGGSDFCDALQIIRSTSNRRRYFHAMGTRGAGPG